MNDQERKDLDEWFAKADDILENWNPRPDSDAMVARAEDEGKDIPLLADSYYTQEALSHFLQGRLVILDEVMAFSSYIL